jgi:hypothetical protein
MRVCVCVRERERGRERENLGYHMQHLVLSLSDLGLFLGVQDSIIKRFKGRLLGNTYFSKWKKISPIKSTLSSLSTYFMSLFSIPISVAHRLENFEQHFLWNGKDDDLKCQLVNRVLRYPIQAWGLGD